MWLLKLPFSQYGQFTENNRLPDLTNFLIWRMFTRLTTSYITAQLLGFVDCIGWSESKSETIRTLCQYNTLCVGAVRIRLGLNAKAPRPWHQSTWNTLTSNHQIYKRCLPKPQVISLLSPDRNTACTILLIRSLSIFWFFLGVKIPCALAMKLRNPFGSVKVSVHSPIIKLKSLAYNSSNFSFITSRNRDLI